MGPKMSILYVFVSQFKRADDVFQPQLPHHMASHAAEMAELRNNATTMKSNGSNFDVYI
jgi:hypothetical protein